MARQQIGLLKMASKRSIHSNIRETPQKELIAQFFASYQELYDIVSQFVIRF